MVSIDFCKKSDHHLQGNHACSSSIVTNAPRENVKFVLEVLKLGDSFDAVVLAEEAIAGKPDPASYQFVFSQLGISPKEAITFEDSPSGIQAPVGAGIYTIGVASTHEAKDLLEAGAAIVIPDFTEHQLWLLLDSFMEQNSSV